MKPHPRIRKTVKWGGAVVSVVLVVAWQGSRWWNIGWYGSQGRYIQLIPFQVDFGRALSNDPLDRVFLFTERALDRRHRWFGKIGDGPGGWYCCVDLAPPAAMFLIVTAVAWRLDTLARRRARVDFCPKCGYALAGLPPASPCPECGTAPTPPSPSV